MSRRAGASKLSQAGLAQASKVATKTVADFEREDRKPYDRKLADIRLAIESAGAEFTLGDQTGVRLRKSTDSNLGPQA